MDSAHAVYLALLQGFTEFLPISSSGHLILMPKLLGWQEQGLAFDISVHLGTLSAVIYYFRKELVPMAHDWTLSVTKRRHTVNSRLAWAVLLGTIPVGLAGLLFKGFIEEYFRDSMLVIAITSIVFGLLLWWADVFGSRKRDEYTIGLLDIVVIGISQALALIPGTSRSGATMTAGLFLGLTREASARFSFLLSIPVIILSGGLVAVDIVRSQAAVDWNAMAIGVGVSGVTAYLCIHYFLKLLDKMGMWPFVVYRLILGAVLLKYAAA